MSRDELRDKVVDLYLDTGKFHSVREIAEKTGVAEHKVRKLVEDERGFPASGLQSMRDWAPSRNAAGMTKVRRYGPTLTHLRFLLRVERDRNTPDPDEGGES